MKAVLRSLAAGALVALTVAAAACGDDSSSGGSSSGGSDIRAIGVKVDDAAFVVPASLAPGLAEFELTVSGQAPHQMQLLKLNDGVTPEQVFTAAASPDPGPLFGLVSVAGGVGMVAPGRVGSATFELSPGTYVAFDFSAPTTKPGVFTVTGASVEADAPKTAATVHLVDFGFDMPAQVRRGDTLELVNDGRQPHELTVMKVAPGTTKEAIVEAMHSGAQPDMLPLGGLGAVNPGQKGYLTVDLEPGTYAAFCFVPDAASGKAHAEMGMIAVFTVG